MKYLLLACMLMWPVVTVAQDDVPVFTDRDLEKYNEYEDSSAGKPLEQMTPEEIDRMNRGEASDDPCDNPALDKAIASLYEIGTLMKLTQYGEAYVDRAWYLLTVTDKERMAHILAQYYACNYSAFKAVRIEIFDGYSGKKIAKYDETWGFRSLE